MQNNIINKRNYLFDNLKALLIFLVVFGHCIERYIHDSNILKSLYFFIYIFHMPLFVFISGYFSKSIKKCKISALNNALIPYILFNIIWYGTKSIDEGKLIFSFTSPGWTLWYLLSLFYWRISLKYLVKIKNIVPISMIFAICMGVTGIGYLSISRTFAFLPFFLLGYYCDENTINRIKKINSKYCYLALVAIFLISIYLVFELNVNVTFLYHSRSYSNFNLNILVGILFKTLAFIGAIILSVATINLIPCNKTIYSYIGKHTLTVYLLHIYLLKILYELIPTFGEDILSNIVILSSSFIITIVLSSNIIQKLYYNTFGKIKIKDKKSINKDNEVLSN